MNEIELDAKLEMDEATIRQRLSDVAVELHVVRDEMKLAYSRRIKLIHEETDLISKLTGLILADGGCNEKGEPLTKAQT